MRYRFYTADVFTGCVFGGNPLAVFPEGRGLDAGQMRQVAREFNVSETVFVFPADAAGHACRLRIFTPGVELPFAGHPTLGAAHVLASIGAIPLEGRVTRVVFEEGLGPVPVSIYAEKGRPVFAKLTAPHLPEFGPPPPALEQIARSLTLDVSDLWDKAGGTQAVSCGVPFLFVPLSDRRALARAQLNRELWNRFISTYWAPHLYIFTYDPELSGSDLRARMFAPAMGIEEDPATGSAATALGGYLGVRDETADGTLHWKVEQGFEMGRPSMLHIEAEKVKGEIVSIRLGGAAVLVSEGTMEIPSAALGPA